MWKLTWPQSRPLLTFSVQRSTRIQRYRAFVETASPNSASEFLYWNNLENQDRYRDSIKIKINCNSCLSIPTQKNVKIIKILKKYDVSLYIPKQSYAPIGKDNNRKINNANRLFLMKFYCRLEKVLFQRYRNFIFCDGELQCYYWKLLFCTLKLIII